MNTRSRTIASFFSVAMAAMLFGAVVTNQIQRPAAAEARNLDPGASPPPVGPGGSITLDTFKEIARRQTAGVVNIGTKKVVRRSRGNQEGLQDLFGDDFMERFFGPQGNGGGGGSDAQTQRSLGSGVVIDKDGTILTNRHVIDGADEITVSIGRHDYPAKLIGKDARTDMAVLKIEPKEALTVLALGNSDQTEVGEWVMAVGNPFGLGGNSVTVGVVSYKGRALTLGTPVHLGGHDPDGRRDQSGQLGRAAPEHAGRGHRDQHPDHHARGSPVGRCRVRGAHQRGQGDPASAPLAREGRARLAGHPDPAPQR
jgi:S1-C subfamily serine protease